ncbi:MAG TPA: hypothetical protein PLN25_01895 [Deltaproteobacteria bacterium]|nr:hypothetical protein [Deltaproteobacteria bacterium]HQB38268.1 hypothetical protein [Deltaproteobacteria bacterium]
MRSILAVIITTAVFLPCVACGAEESGVQPATMEKYQRVKLQVEKLPSGKAQKYASEVIGQTRKSIAAAQDGLKTGNDKLTREYTEMAALQVTLAGVLAEEREAAEKADAARKRLDELNARLSRILTGKGDK